ncbi:type VI secretion system baseplate subunit TssF [Endozoicomonas sp. OPT23]|uniref:type VI secretion system baseplate subunit TssF n=1 Tax=Endozoicomonas sp. OPT23 TaxID=2072845 RepID=UPI00129BEEF8|nr:type VI secretion system baseplate subunit TssF [Endozoicomonas sp. OPT23]MRI32660.1 type VI secretion system baseplate subunit TssF [Endozoicomonas sp. OPT23]
MSDLSLWYERELGWFRKYAGQFADNHPGLARSLGVSNESIEDPDVARLVESVALLNARLSSQLEEEQPLLTDSLIRILFPHFLRPLPSAGMMQLPASSDVASIQHIPAGSLFRARIDDERHCDFRTCTDAQLLPFKLTDAEVELAPFSLPAGKTTDSVDAMLRLDLELCDDSLNFYSIGNLEYLNVFLKGENSLTQRLYDQLFSQVYALAIYDDSGHQIKLPASALEPVLIDKHERILPLSGRTFSGYQLLLEYMAYHNLFLSFRITGLDGVLSQFSNSRLSLAVYLRNIPVELARGITSENFQLGCAPVVNLFDRRGEPLKVDHTRLGYPLEIDARSANHYDVFSVNSVLDISGVQPEPLPEIYGHKYYQSYSSCFWHYQPSYSSRGSSYRHGELALTDLDLKPWQAENRQLSPRLTCYNGAQPMELSLKHELSCQENIAMPVTPQLLGKTTAPWQPELRQANRWALLAHLKFNFEALLRSDDPVNELRELLSLYNLNNNASLKSCIDSIVSMDCESKVAPIKVQSRQCFVQGTDITLTLDRARISGVSIMSFIQVLDRLFAGYAGYNSFTRLKVAFKSESGFFYLCPRRQG